MNDIQQRLISAKLAALKAAPRPAQIVNRRGAEADIFFYGIVGMEEYGGISDRMFVDELRKAEGASRLNVYMNSPGGDFFAGLAIYNQLSRFKGEKRVIIDGTADSAASVIAMAGDRIVMAPEATIMIHEVRTLGTAGTSADLRKLADQIDGANVALREIYGRRTGIEDSRLTELMSAETRMTAQQAVEMKFADEVEMPQERKVALAAASRTVTTKLTPLDWARMRARLAEAK